MTEKKEEEEKKSRRICYLILEQSGFIGSDSKERIFSLYLLGQNWKRNNNQRLEKTIVNFSRSPKSFDSIFIN